MRPNKSWVLACRALVALILCVLLASSALAELEQDPESDLQDFWLAPVVSTETVYICNDTRLLIAPQGTAMPLKMLSFGSQVELVGVDGEWAQVNIGALTGYVQKQDLSFRNPSELSAVYTTGPAYMHLEAKPSSKILARLASGQKLQLLSAQVTWARVRLASQDGYVLVKHLTKHSSGAGGVSAAKPGDKGDNVRHLQQRLKVLGYLVGEVDGKYKDETRASVLRFQRSALLKETGEADDITLSTLFLSNAPHSRTVLSGTARPATGPVIDANWWNSGIADIFARQTSAVVTDVETGISFRVWRGGGTNHADVQPLTAEDTAQMKMAYGGHWSWARRAIWVSVDGQRYAASMNGMHHGQGSIQGNNFNGHFCIHFRLSRTHGTNHVCPMHQACVDAALTAGNSSGASARVSLSAKSP